MRDLPAREALVRWLHWQHHDLFPQTMIQLLGVAARQRKKSPGRKLIWTSGDFLRRLDKMKSDADLRRFVSDSGRVDDVMRISSLLYGLELLVADLPEAHFVALNNRLALKPSVLYAVRLALEYVD